MPQREIEVVLMRQLASYLTMPILVLDPEDNLVFFNEAAEAILGRRFDETGEIHRDDWVELFRPTKEDGSPLRDDERPLLIAAQQRRPSHSHSWIHGLDGVRREIEGIAFPLLGQGDRYLGVAGIFWEVQRE